MSNPPAENQAPENFDATTSRAFDAIVAEWRQSWRPGVAAMVGGAVAYSVWPSVSSLFIAPLQQTFGWSRGEISFAANSGLLTAFAAPIVGRLVDRKGVRPVLLIGLALTALAYVILAMMTGALYWYYASYLFFALVGMSTTGITYTRVVAGAFHNTRGSALAISRSGLALTGALLPALIFLAIREWSYIGGYLALAALIMFIAFPLAWAWIDPKPLQPMKSKAEMASMKSEHWATQLRRPKVLVLALAGALSYAPVVAILSQMMPLATSKGISAEIAVGAISAIGLAAIAGAFISGLLVDRLWAPGVAFLLTTLPAIGCLILLTEQLSPLMLFSAAVLVGLGQGAEIDILAFMVARYFGLRNYATIYGLTVLIIGLFTSFGVSTIGFLYDRFGSYDFALTLAAASFTFSAGLYLAMGRYPKPLPE